MPKDQPPPEKVVPLTVVVAGQNYTVDKHFDSEYEKKNWIIALVKETWGIGEKFTGELVLQFYIGGYAGVKKTEIFK